MAQAVQLLVVDWSAAVRWAGLCTGRRLRGREDLVAAWDSSHRREDTDLSPRNLFFVHLHCLRRTTRNKKRDNVEAEESNNESFNQRLVLKTDTFMK